MGWTLKFIAIVSLLVNNLFFKPFYSLNGHITPISVAASVDLPHVSFDRDTGFCEVNTGTDSVRYNTSECYYIKNGVLYYRDLNSEQTYVFEGNGIRDASDAESKQMSVDVYGLTGVDIRRQKLITNDISEGNYYGVTGCDYHLNQPIPAGSSDYSEDSEALNGSDAFDNNIGNRDDGNGGGDDDEEAVPTPEPISQPDPEVPIVIPVIE